MSPNNLHGEERADGGLWRRTFLKAGALAGSSLAVPQRLWSKPREEPSALRPFSRYAELLETLEQRGHKFRVLGYAPDRSPVVAVKAGGTKKPAIFISAGSHSTEQAGVTAAVELIEQLETEHEVFVLPCRDPIGLNGYRYALSLSLGEEPQIGSLQEAEQLLREQGEVLYDADDTLLALVGQTGYANRGLYRQFEKGEPFLEPLKGRRIYFPSRSTDMPGAGPLERAYTLIVTPDAEILHINRFHDTPWAPVEVRCTRRLMAEIDPKLTFDLHEYGGDAYWMSARRQRTDEDEMWERRMASAAAEAVAAAGGKLAPPDYSPGSFFTKLERGVFWLDPGERGEGLNLVDYASRKYGPAFTIETGMQQPFDHRARLQMLVVQTAVKLFEQRYS